MKRMMNSRDIQIALYQHFHNYEYKLGNTYVFDWESDFFAMSKSGYFLEAEIKISRGDYFADFQKIDKHRVLSDNLKRKSHFVDHIKTYGSSKGDLIVEYESSAIRWDNPSGILKSWDRNRNGRYYMTNYYGDSRVIKQWNRVFAPCCAIKVTPIEKVTCPHNFYYACPENMIKINELPPYAGLIYLNDNYPMVKVVKKAPYLHKRPLNLDKVLLNKFYWLWLRNVDFDRKIEIQKNSKQPQLFNP